MNLITELSRSQNINPTYIVAKLVWTCSTIPQAPRISCMDLTVPTIPTTSGLSIIDSSNQDKSTHKNIHMHTLWSITVY